MNKIWQVSSNDWFLRDVSGTVPSLNNTIYVLERTTLGELYLRDTGKKFEFNFKLYGLKSDLIERTMKYYDNSKGNLGILLNGVKGTGKTITGKVLANQLDMPIILIEHKYPGLVGFLSQIDADVVVMVDEYDKVFTEVSTRYNAITGEDDTKEDSTLLSLMDAVFSNSYRRTFILTTNELWLNENMINRPGRIRYKETFKDLEIETIYEILDDLLVYTEHREGISSFLRSLKLLTVDILKAIVTEVNIFNEDPTNCCKSMNLEFLADTYSIYEIKNGEKMLLDKDYSQQSHKAFMTNLKRNYTNAVLFLQGGTAHFKAAKKYVEGENITIQNVYDKDDIKEIVFVEEKASHESFNHNLSMVF